MTETLQEGAWEFVGGIGLEIHCDGCGKSTEPFWLGPEQPRIHWGVKLRKRLCPDCYGVQAEMTETGVPTAIWSGTFRLFGVDVRCHTLDDGQRIIEAHSMAELLTAMAGGADAGDGIGDFFRWQSSRNLNAGAPS